MREGRNKGMMLVPLGPWREKETTGPAEVPAVPEVNPGVFGYPREGVGEGNGTPLQYSCLENPMDGGAW